MLAIRRAIFALAALMSGCAQVPQTDVEHAHPGAPLKIATWNIEHLAQANGVGCRPRTDTDYAELRGHVDALGADVIAFQEVENKAAAERVFDPARYDVVMSGRPVSRRGGECYGAPGQSIRQQAVGFAIRKGVRWTRNTDLADLALGNPDLRWGVDVTIEGDQPLRLLAIHLKSGCNSGQTSSDPDCPVLFGQMPVLRRWIDARVAAGQAYAILGDWNRRLAATGDQFFIALDRQQPPTADLTLASGGRPSMCKSRYRDFIDHIATGAKASARIVAGSFNEYTYGVTEDRHPADHCPQSIVLR